jgi:hypothetical protein
MEKPRDWKPETKKGEVYKNIMHTTTFLKESAYMLAAKALLSKAA